MKNKKKLTLCKNEDAILLGVCGGIADYFEIDQFFVRLGFILCGFGLFIYFILYLIMPEHPKN